MIEQQTIEGRKAMVSYLDTKFNPQPKDKATLIQVFFDDGELIYLTPEPDVKKGGPGSGPQEGHDFRGNQYTGGLGGGGLAGYGELAEPSEGKHPGGVKGHVHELLASGKSWTISELAQATGAKEERVKFLLSRLQSPKYAAANKDALVIQRVGNQYQVIGTKPALTSAEKWALKTKTEQAKVGTNAISAKSFDMGNPHNFVDNNKKVNDLVESHEGAAGNLKDHVASTLAKTLEDHENWMKVAEAYSKKAGLGTPVKGISYQLTNQIIHGWACTSADDDTRAKAMQLAARDEFDIKDASLGHMGIHSKEDEERVWNNAARQFGFPKVEGPGTIEGHLLYYKVSPEDIATFKSAMRAFTRAEYENTQAWFKERGITEVSLFRGTKQSASDKPVVTTLHGQPLSSFSSRAQTAQGFGSRVYMATFPVSHVVGSCQTGRGCLNEREVVVLGHPIKVVRTSRAYMYHHSINQIGQEAFSGKH